MLSKINLTFIALVFLVLLSAVLQADLLPYLSINQAVPNLVLILLILLVSQKKNILALYLALFSGIILDINFGIGFGPYLITYLLIYGLVYLFQRFVFKDEAIIFYILLVLFATIIFDISLIGIINIYGFGVSLVQFWQVILREVAYNVLVSLAVFGLYNYSFKKRLTSSGIKLPESL